LLIALTAVAGCNKKKEPLPSQETAPSAGAVPPPTAHITANPGVISAGDQVQLSWRTTDATSISIDGIGDVPSTGVKTVTPTASTTFHLVARGDGGSAEDTARVTVNGAPAVSVPVSELSEEEEFKAGVQDAFFDYDTYDIRADAARNALVTAGVAAGRIRIISYGKEKPFCSESTEECWQQNRRAGFSLDR